MSTKSLLSALLVSSFSMSLISAATEIKEATADLEPTTVFNFTAKSKASQQRILAINDQTSEGFPFTRTAENNADQIVIKNSKIGTLDTWFFQNNKSLKKVSFEGSTVNLDPFVGHTFLEGCDAIEVVSFKGVTGVDLVIFLEEYASPTLLRRILDKKCKLFIDMLETGATMANFAKEGVFTQESIHYTIRTKKILEATTKEKAAATPEVKPRSWLSTFTFGYLGE